MVSPGGASRGQIILVGAVAIALVVLGFALVLNTTAYTDEVSSSSADGARGSLEGLEREVYRDSASVLVRSNHVERYASRSALNATLAENFAGYSRLLTESYTDGEAGFVAVEYRASESIYGARLVQSEDRPFTGPAGSPDWNLTGRQTEVGWFVLNVNVSAGTEAAFDVNVTSQGSAEYARYAFERDDDSGALNVSVTYRSGGATRSVDATCAPSNDRVLVDLVEGSAYDGGCSFPGLSVVDPPYNVSVNGGDRARGLYELVAEDPASVSGPVCAPGVPRCVSPAVWQASVSLFVETGATTYDETRYVRSYGRDVKPLFDALVSGDVVFTRYRTVGHHDEGGATALGPATASLTGDYRRELPAVVSPGPGANVRIVLVDRNNRTTPLTTTGNVQRDDSLLAVGRWQGSPTSVFYASRGGQIFRVDPGSPPQQVTTGTVRAESVAGIGDVDGDGGARELVYVDRGADIDYVDDDGSVRTTGESAFDRNAVGPPVDLDGDGTASVPYVTADREVALLDDAGTVVLTGAGTAVGAPLVAADVDGDADREVVFVETGTNDLAYVDDVRTAPTVRTLTDRDGDPVPGDAGTGVVAG